MIILSPRLSKAIPASNRGELKENALTLYPQIRRLKNPIIMNHYGIVPENHDLTSLGLQHADNVFWNLTPADLVEETIANGMGQLSDTGALAVDTGEFTGRSPKDRFIVEDDITRDAVWWGNINLKFDAEKFDRLYNRVTAYLAGKEVYVRDAYACSSEKYKLNIRV